MQLCDTFLSEVPRCLVWIVFNSESHLSQISKDLSKVASMVLLPSVTTWWTWKSYLRSDPSVIVLHLPFPFQMFLLGNNLKVMNNWNIFQPFEFFSLLFIQDFILSSYLHIMAEKRYNCPTSKRWSRNLSIHIFFPIFPSQIIHIESVKFSADNIINNIIP